MLLLVYNLPSINRVEGLILFWFLQGTKIIDESQDQDTTDLHKCVAYIRDLVPNTDISEVSLISDDTLLVFCTVEAFE